MKNEISLLSTQANIALGTILVNLLLTFVTALFILWIYRRTTRSASYDPAFTLSLFLVSLITCQIMMTIGQNLALSLGLVGALSIVRFRMAIKDTLDLVFLFFAIAVGLAYGASAHLVGGFGALVTGLLVLLVAGKTSWLRAHSGYNLHLKVDTGDPAEWQHSFEEKMKALARNLSMTAFSPVREESAQSYQYTYQLQLRNEAETGKVISALTTLPGLKDHQFFSSGDLPV